MMVHGLSIQDGLLLSLLPRKEGKQRHFPHPPPPPPSGWHLITAKKKTWNLILNFIFFDSKVANKQGEEIEGQDEVMKGKALEGNQVPGP